MYSERDMDEINARIRRNWLTLIPVLAALLAAYVYALAARVEWLAMTAGPLLFVAACYGILAYLWPNHRYRSFLRDMQDGLSRDVRCTIVAVSDQAELQDGAKVLPVRVELAPEEADGREEMRASKLAERIEAQQPENTRNERIVYLNASKRAGFPEPGAKVLLHCYGRHIKDVERDAA